jgi:hypothetical protein
MSGQRRSCTRQDLRAVVPQWNRWSVDDQGNSVEQTEAGDPDGDVEEYECVNCWLSFMPDGHSRVAFELAWKEAVDHLAQPDAPEPTAMACCLPSISRAASSKETRNEPS